MSVGMYMPDADNGRRKLQMPLPALPYSLATYNNIGADPVASRNWLRDIQQNVETAGFMNQEEFIDRLDSVHIHTQEILRGKLLKSHKLNGMYNTLTASSEYSAFVKKKHVSDQQYIITTVGDVKKKDSYDSFIVAVSTNSLKGNYRTVEYMLAIFPSNAENVFEDTTVIEEKIVDAFSTAVNLENFKVSDYIMVSESGYQYFHLEMQQFEYSCTTGGLCEKLVSMNNQATSAALQANVNMMIRLIMHGKKKKYLTFQHSAEQFLDFGDFDELDDENAMSMERSTLMHLAKKVDRVDETESPRLRLSVQQSKTDLFRMPTNTTFHDGETVESVYLDVGGSGVKWAFRTSENRIVQPFTTEKRDAPLDDTADIPLKKKMTRASVDGAVWDWSGGTVETPVGDLEYNAKLLEKLIPQTYDKVVRYARSVSRVGNGKRLPLIVTQAGDICGGRGHGRLKNGKSMDESHDFGASWTDEVPLTEVYKTISETLPDDVPMTVINDGFSHYLGFAELAKRTGEAIDFPALTMTF
eukprot:gene654-1086_t